MRVQCPQSGFKIMQKERGHVFDQKKTQERTDALGMPTAESYMVTCHGHGSTSRLPHSCLVILTDIAARRLHKSGVELSSTSIFHGLSAD